MPLISKLKRLRPNPNLVIIFASFILLSPVLIAGKALFWGTPALQFVPWWKFAFDTLLSGHLPLWNPLLGMGAPLVANYQSALFYPPNWIFFVFYIFGGVSGLAWSQALVVVLHLAGSGLGMAALTRRIGLSKLGQTVSGLAFGLSGYLVARAWFASINAAATWLPWILLFAFDLVRNQSKKRNFIKLGLVIGLQLLAGHAQTSWYTLLLAGFWVAFLVWQRQISEIRIKIQSVLQIWLSLGLTVCLGVALAAVQLFPTTEYLLQSQRAAAVDYEAAMTYSFWPWRFLGFIAPDLFGTPVIGDYWGYANYWEDAVYIGLLPFLLACGVILRGIFRKKSNSNDYDPQTKNYENDLALTSQKSYSSFHFFLVFITLISFLLALGKNTSIFPWLYTNIPTFDMFNSPTRFSIWAVFALSLIAGIGSEYWKRPVKRGLYWTRLATAGAFAISLGAGLGWLLLRDVATDFHPSFVRALALTGFWGLGSGILSLFAPKNEPKDQTRSPLWIWAVTLWVSADLIFAGWGLNPGISLDFFTQEPPNYSQIQELVGNGRLFLLTEDESTIKYDQYFIFESFDPGENWYDIRAAFLPNSNMLVNVPMVNNYDPLVPGSYSRWMEEVSKLDVYQRPDLLGLMGVTIIEKDFPSGKFGVVFEPIESVDRVRWVPCARSVEGEESAWKMVFSDQVDFQTEVVLETADPNQIQNCTPSNGVAEIVDEHPNKVLVQVESQSPGWLVLSDVWYPGWTARVKGEKKPIYKADFLFRGVAVPAGTQFVEFSYRPIWFYTGAAVSFLTWFGIFGYFIWKRRK